MLSSPVNSSWFPGARNCLFWTLILWLAQFSALADQSVALTWNPSTDPNTVGYRIYYGGASGDYTNVVDVGNATNVIVSGLNDGDTFYFAATTVTGCGDESAFSNEAMYVMPVSSTNAPVTNTPPVAATPPTLDPISNLSIYQNACAQTVTLTGISSGSANGNPVVISAASSDPTIIPTPTVSYASPNSTGTLTFTPLAGALGTVTITVTVDNGNTTNHVVSEAFTVTVAAAPVAAPTPVPSLDSITNLSIYQNAGPQTIPLTGISSGITSGYQFICIWAYSSDTSLISNPTVNYSSPNDSGTLTFVPVTNALGTVSMDVKVNNGVANFCQGFTVTIVPAPVVQAVAVSTNAGAPTLNSIANVSVLEGVATASIPLSGIAAGSSAPSKSSLKFTTASSNPKLVPAPTIRYTCPDTNAVLTLRFAPAASGSATITVSANNGAASNNVVCQTFTVTITPPAPPTLNPIANITVAENAAAQTIPLTGISGGANAPTNETLRITVSSSNSKAFTPRLQYASPACAGSLILTPTAHFSGQATVTVTVDNGNQYNGSVKQQFTFTAVPTATNTSVLASVASTVGQVVGQTNQPASLTPVASLAGAFSFQVTGVAGGKYVVQATSDLANWTAIQTNTAPFVFSDSTVGVQSRFYRAVSAP